MLHCVKHPKLDHGQMSSSRSSCAGERGHHLQLAPSWMYDQVRHKPRVKMSCITFNRLNSRDNLVLFTLCVRESSPQAVPLARKEGTQ